MTAVLIIVDIDDCEYTNDITDMQKCTSCPASMMHYCLTYDNNCFYKCIGNNIFC